MKISIFGFENKIEFEDDVVNVLEIEDQKLYVKVINSINNLTNNISDEENEIIIVNDDQKIEFYKNVYIMFDIFNIDYNSKQILNNIYEIVSKNIRNSDEFEYDKILLQLKNYLIKEINEMPFELIMEDEIKIEDLLKIFKLKIDIDNYLSVMEKLMFMIDTISLFNLYKLLIIPNLKLYFNKEDIVEIYKYSKYKNVKLLIIENKLEEKMLKYEKKNIIDVDFNDEVKV